MRVSQHMIVHVVGDCTWEAGTMSETRHDDHLIIDVRLRKGEELAAVRPDYDLDEYTDLP